MIRKIDQKKTVNKTLVRVFCKLAIFWTTTGLGANFIGKTLKCGSDDH